MLPFIVTTIYTVLFSGIGILFWRSGPKVIAVIYLSGAVLCPITLATCIILFR